MYDILHKLQCFSCSIHDKIAMCCSRSQDLSMLSILFLSMFFSTFSKYDESVNVFINIVLLSIHCCVAYYTPPYYYIIVEKVINVYQNCCNQALWSLFGQFTNCRPNPSANCVHTADADATKQFCRVGVSGVYWA